MGISRIAWYVFIFLVGYCTGYLLNLMPQISWHLIPFWLVCIYGLKELNEAFKYHHIRVAVAKSINPKMPADFFTFAVIIARAGIIGGSFVAWLP